MKQLINRVWWAWKPNFRNINDSTFLIPQEWQESNDSSKQNIFPYKEISMKNNLGPQKICHVQAEIVDGDVSFHDALQ